jgi:hypothetical protein
MRNKKRYRVFLMAVLGTSILLQHGCVTVKLTEGGERARVLRPEDVVRCERLGKTTVSVQDRVIGIPLAKSKVQRDLNNLARNSSINMGGDSVVPMSDPNAGEQVFEVYKCLP